LALRDRRGFYGSWQRVGQGVALLLGALVSAVVTRGLPPEALDSWGWRIPFLFGLLIGPVGVYIRLHLDETDAFIEVNATPRQEVGLGTLIATHFSEAMVCLGLATGQTIQAYVILLYMPTFATTQFGLPLGEALTAQSIGLACLIVAVPLSGALSDHVGRKPIMMGAYVARVCMGDRGKIPWSEVVMERCVNGQGVRPRSRERGPKGPVRTLSLSHGHSAEQDRGGARC
jgi:MFS transporter, MHS family, proline/betaine transporter